MVLTAYTGEDGSGGALSLRWMGLAVLVGVVAVGQTVPPVKEPGQTTPPAPTEPQVVVPGQTTTITVDTRLSARQEKDLAASEQEILKFVSKDTGLPIQAPVKLKFVSREAVKQDLRKKFDEDKSAKRMERSELVLKKFGLLDPDFHLKPFLLSLLTEQIAGFYDNKTKQMTLLDWVPIDEQKPVMAHELTHALQDQKVGLTKWGDQEIEGVAKNVVEDNKHIQTDELDTAREAVLEGQAMVSFANYALETNGQPGKTIKDFPQMIDKLEEGAGDMGDSPVLGRAPLVLQQALLFPYNAGLSFEATVLLKQGSERAFAGVLDAPPSSSYEILNPDAYMRHVKIPVLVLPDIHPMLKEAGYEPYDIGQMGELDVRMTAELFGGKPLAVALAPNWDGGIYYAAQRTAATAAEKQTTASIALLYSSHWKNEDSARSFFEVFDQELPRQYSGLVRRNADEKDETERVYSTREGDVLLTLAGKSVWVSEGFEVGMARRMREAVDKENLTVVGPVVQAGSREWGVGGRGLVGGLSGWVRGFGVVRSALRYGCWRFEQTAGSSLRSEWKARKTKA